jgi:tetratricopeptide (TPR) repeat protein
MKRDSSASPSEQAFQAFNEAIGFHQRGRLDEAEKFYRQVLRQQPDHFGSLHLLGVIYAQRGDHAAALRQIDAALRINRYDADALNNRGIALKELKRLDEALASYDQALQLNPGHADAFINRGVALLGLKRLDEALLSFDRAIALKPGHADAFNNRGNVLMDLQRLDEALASYDRAIALKSNDAEFFNNRGNALKDLNRLDEALASYGQAIALNPRHVDAYNNRGVALMELKRLDEALASYDRAIALRPDYAEAFNNRGMARLLTGRYREGWADHEWRWKAKTYSGVRPKLDAPVWQGEDVDGRRILVFGEQGLGDVIQFVRYLPLLAQRGAKVTLLVRENLIRLLRPLSSKIEIVGSLKKHDSFDFQCALMSLPWPFGTDLNSIPNQVPYLEPEEDRVERWKQFIGEHGFKIGIAWQAKIGSTPAVRMHGLRRSFPLAELIPLSRLPGVRLISLQKHHGLDQLTNLPAGATVEILGDDFDGGPDAFIDTAAAMSNLDLIITPDTSIAHLAGALGRPTWVALSYVPDWRWLLNRDDSLWYPTVRLFRQGSDGDWKSAISKIEQALRALVRPPSH